MITGHVPDFAALAGSLRNRWADAIQPVGESFRQAAADAYADTRWGDLFTIESAGAIVGFDLIQPDDLFQVVEWPTGPHVIEPRDAQALFFYIAGAAVFTRHVDHPGTHGRQAIEPLFEQAQERFVRALELATLDLFRG